MRMLKKRVHIISLFLILSFLFLPAASILMIHHITVSETIVGMDAGFLGTSSSAFAIRKESITMREVAAVAAACGKNIAVYQDYKGPEQVRAIYFSGTYANLPMMEGRFFQESDFTAGNRCAVVGKTGGASSSSAEERPISSCKAFPLRCWVSWARRRRRRLIPPC